MIERNEELGKIEKQTLNFLLCHTKSVEDLKLVREAIKDYREDSGFNFNKYKHIYNHLRKDL